MFKDGKAMDLRFTVEEGGRYRMGDITISSDEEETVTQNGVEVKIIGGLPKTFLEGAFPLRKGDIFDVTKVRKSLEDYTKLFGEFGYINFNALPSTEVDDDARTVDVTLDFEPNKQFLVRRIEFTGNTSTRDKVIRREILLEEGGVFNSRRWETSVLRLNQLGYFEELQPESADVRQNAEEGTVDLSLKVKERGKNSIGFNGGTSGTFGSFVGLNYSTNNFMGLGETLSVDFQVGDRNTAFVVGFTEPYMFDRPLQMGMTFTVRKFEFDQARQASLATGLTNIIDDQLRDRLLNYDQNTVGFSVFTSYPMRKWGFGRLGLNYAFSNSDITCGTEACEDLFGGLAFRGLEGPSSLNGIVSSRVSASYVYNTVNHPIFPTAGTSFFISTSVEGGPLGGNQQTIRPTVEVKHFRPINQGRNTLAFRLQLGFVTGYGGFVPSPFNRFYIGGEQDIRGFDIQRITPLAFQPRRTSQPVIFLDPTRPDANGNPTSQTAVVDILTQSFSFPGGDTQAIMNFEYRIPLVGPIELAPFWDVGLNSILRPSQLRLRQAELDSLRSLFPTATVPDNLNIVDGTNTKVRSSAGLELVINLPILQAPFRIYWAYNVSRFDGRITVPGAVVQESADFPLPPGVLEQQILNNPQLQAIVNSQQLPFAEPLKTFRFTISRTF
jgi:outer membrane protein insertion porin family